jgi:group I intron endonuclease
MKIYTIYRITNLINNKVYIGFDSSWPRRKAQHKNIAKYYVGTNVSLYNAIKKHGWDNFVWDIIYQSTDGDYTKNTMESYFITEYNSFVYAVDSNGYNMTLGGEGILGHQKSQESINSQKEKMQGKKQSPEHIARRVATARLHPNFGKPTGRRPPNFGEAIRARLLGVKKSESHKEAMRKRPQDTLNLKCPHCDKTGDYKNMKRWHMDRCKYNVDRKTDLLKTVTCNMCGFSANESPNFYKNHNTNCKGY